MPDDLIVVEETPIPVQELARLLNLLLEAERGNASAIRIASTTRSALQEMHESHLANIALREQLLV
jgi:hypothetical protein